MKTQEKFPYKVIEYPDMTITMSDGCRLSARVWMPEDASHKPMPVILEHLPYRKRDGTIVRDEYTHPWFAGHGYVCIRTDMRGNGESDGLMEDEYTQQELDDACEVIAWAASQPWCNGNVGMMGISWGGFNCLQVAAMAPTALKAVISLCSTVDRYADDIHYKGGCLLTTNFGWAANMLSYSSRPPDPMLVGEKWRDIWLTRLEEQPWHWSTWLRHQHRDNYWKHGSICEDFSAINAAVLSIGGWHDGYRNTISHLVENINAPVKGIVGPWIHKYPHYAGPLPAIGFLQEAKRWWDHWLKDQPTGVEADPAYRAWIMDWVEPERWHPERPGRWIAETQWPSPEITTETKHLGADGLASTSSEFDIQISSPQDCGSMGGKYFPFAFGDELPGEQSADDVLSACFDSKVIDVDQDIVGAPAITLTLSANKPNAQLAVRLCDISPDGTSAHITHGFLNLTHWQSDENPSPLKPGDLIETTFSLDQIAYRIPAGHRLRVAISTGYWPYIWPSPEESNLSIKQGRIELPIRPLAITNEWKFEEPVAAPEWQAEVLRKSEYTHVIDTDPATSVVTTKVFCDNGENRDMDHGLISGSWSLDTCTIHPDDPLSAKQTAEWEQTGGRDGQMWRTHVQTEMTSNKTHFFSKARLRAYENDKMVFEREFKDEVKRDLV